MHSTCPVTRECLKELGKKCQTYDQIINHLIERRKEEPGVHLTRDRNLSNLEWIQNEFQ